jgi:SAM-dependent MidA family methyltransferase
MPAASEKTPLYRRLVERIRANGPITFAQYMEACLYDPEFGYYARGGNRRRADYYTSVDVSPLFGALLARQLHEMWQILGRPPEFTIAEPGAGDAALARHVLDFVAARLPDFYAALRYHAIESSPARRSLHAPNLGPHFAAGIARSFDQFTEHIGAGCIFSNEFVDALPVHRVEMEGGKLREIYVDVAGEELVEGRKPISTPEIADYFAEQGIRLHENQQAEAGLAACQWIEDAGRRLQQGFILTIDYGREARELYDDRHMRGRALAYSRHRASEDFYRAPGEEDLTAHANFTALDVWGRRAGLIRTGFTSQTNFLLALARANDFADVRPPEISTGFDTAANDPAQIKSRLRFQSLIHPEGMGETFQVMAQHIGIDQPRLTGFEPL